MNLDASIIAYIDEKLFLLEHLTKDECVKFREKIEKYLNNRSSKETFFKNLDGTVEFLEKIGLNYHEIIMCIFNWPSIIHSDKNDLLYKYLVLGIPKRYNLSDIDRDDILVNHPKDLMTGIDTVYARIMFFLSEESKDVTRKNVITRRKLLKITNKEFEEFYGISRDNIVSKYPFTKDSLKNVLSLDYNKEVVERFYGNSKEFGRRSS